MFGCGWWWLVGIFGWFCGGEICVLDLYWLVVMCGVWLFFDDGYYIGVW